MRKVTIYLVDSHPMLRHGLRSILQVIPDFQIVGESDDGIDALTTIERLRPNILITGLKLQGIAGLELAKLVRTRFKETQVVIFTGYTNETYIRCALKAGVAGYVVKDAELSDVVDAVLVVAAGGKFISDVISSKPAATLLMNPDGDDVAAFDKLTNREKEVLKSTAEGDSYSVIAERLFISPRTVETHRTNAMRKLSLRTRSDLIRYAIRNGLLPAEI